MKHRYAVAALVLMIALSVIVDVPRSAEAGAPPVLRDDDDYEPPTLEQQKVLQMNDQKNKLVAWQCFNYLSKASWAPQQLIQSASDQCDKVWKSGVNPGTFGGSIELEACWRDLRRAIDQLWDAKRLYDEAKLQKDPLGRQLTQQGNLAKALAMDELGSARDCLNPPDPLMIKPKERK